MNVLNWIKVAYQPDYRSVNNLLHRSLLHLAAKNATIDLIWKYWRRRFSDVQLDLRKAYLDSTNLNLFDLSKSNLSESCLNDAVLIKANLSRANLENASMIKANLKEADLSEANLSYANLIGADLRGANLSYANLSGAVLSVSLLRGANLNGSNLVGAILNGANLMEANLQEVNLEGVDLEGASLNNANLVRSNLRNAFLYRTEFLNADLSSANLTGACVESWNISSTTILHDIECDYIYLKAERGEHGLTLFERRPSNNNAYFTFGEFAALVKRSIETIDLIFVDGIDWKAFFASFQELRRKYDADEFNVQAIERKEASFVVRLEVSGTTEKSVIEAAAKELYSEQVKKLEFQYQQQLSLQGAHLEDARRAIESERKEKATLLGIMSTMANNQQGPTYNFQGAKFGGGFATEGASQSGGVLNDYSVSIAQNINDIESLIASIKDIINYFPEQQQIEAKIELSDLETDIKTPEKHDVNRFKKRLKGLLAAGTAAATIAGGAVTFSDNLNQFTDNVLILGEKLGITSEEIRSQP